MTFEFHEGKKKNYFDVHYDKENNNWDKDKKH